jgi:hypothetical protein
LFKSHDLCGLPPRKPITWLVEFFADWRRRIFRTGYTVMSEMAITERIEDTSGCFAIRDTFRPGNILQI